MDYRKIILGAALLVTAPFSWAGLAQVVPAPNWSGTPSVPQFVGAASSPRPGGGFNAPGGVVNVGGRSVTMPAASRFAANAPRVLARGLYGHPALLAGSILGPMLYDYLKDTDLEDIQPPAAGQPWLAPPPPGQCFTEPCYKYKTDYTGYHSSLNEVLQAHEARRTCPDGLNYVRYNHSVPGSFTLKHASGQTYWIYEDVITNQTCREYAENPGAVQTQRDYFTVSYASRSPDSGSTGGEMTEEDFINALAGKAVPEEMFPHIPFPMPVEPPVLIPGDAAVPAPRTMRVPLAAPEAIPGTDPVQHRQEVVDLTQTRVGDDPWWVSTSPKNIITMSAEGVPIPGIDPYPLPETVPTPGPNDPPLPIEQPTSQIDFCINNPSALACQTLGTPLEAVEIDQTVVDVGLIQPAAGWGGMDGACPAPKSVTVGGGMTLQMPYDLICQHARNVRPLIIGFAYLAGGLMLIGVMRK